MKKLKALIFSILPGIFLIGYNIGTGSLTAMSKAGANVGCDLLWAVLLSCLITWYLINFFSRFTMASGLTAMEGFRKYIHPAYAWVLWSGLAVIILSALMAMLKPLFGPAALLVFVIGILSASISSHLPNMMVIPWLTDDIQGYPRNIRTRRKRIVLGGLTLVSMLGVFYDAAGFPAAAVSGRNFTCDADGPTGSYGSFEPQRNCRGSSANACRMERTLFNRRFLSFYELTGFAGTPRRSFKINGTPAYHSNANHLGNML